MTTSTAANALLAFNADRAADLFRGAMIMVALDHAINSNIGQVERVRSSEAVVHFKDGSLISFREAAWAPAGLYAVVQD